MAATFGICWMERMEGKPRKIKTFREGFENNMEYKVQEEKK
jgi:hypothetical protein